MIAQSTQIESAAPVCLECRGARTFADSTCGHLGRCICGEYEEVPCGRCGGSGAEPCSGCGAPSVARENDGEAYCAGCLSVGAVAA